MSVAAEICILPERLGCSDGNQNGKLASYLSRFRAAGIGVGDANLWQVVSIGVRCRHGFGGFHDHS